ncbi:MAG: transposase, partial [Candidatus Delongbacteria bacterium]|nr:transposase [Candidatus Delongbacteria bacterium]
MNEFRLESTDEIISSNSGIILAGKILNSREFRNCVTLALGHQTKYSSSHFTDYEIVKSYIGLLCVGKPRPESIDIFKADKVFMHALGLSKLPSKETLRQRLEKLPANLNFALRDFTAVFIKKHGELPTITGTDYIPIDFDVTPFDNSNSKKEGVSFTYKNFMGYAPMITYIGATGYMLNNEFREGKDHSNCAGTAEYIKRSLELARAITTDKKLLLRFDSGNDSVENILVIAPFESAYFLIRRNLRSKDRDKYIDIA